MRGLRTQENEAFLRFFNIVQQEAKKKDSVFFCDCGQGDESIKDGIECESMFGWLIPENDAERFEKEEFIPDRILESSNDFYVGAEYKIDGDITIQFR